MKFVLFLVYLYNLEKCGYQNGSKGKEMEKWLDECYKKNVSQSWLKMSIGFELCFGFNYKKLNETVAELINHKKEEVKETIIQIRKDSCQID